MPPCCCAGRLLEDQSIYWAGLRNMDRSMPRTVARQDFYLHMRDLIRGSCLGEALLCRRRAFWLLREESVGLGNEGAQNAVLE